MAVSERPACILFLCSGNTQAKDVTALSALFTEPVHILRLDNLELTNDAAAPGGMEHVPAATAWRMLKVGRIVSRFVRAHCGRVVLVTGQDIGRLQRVALAAATRAGARTALVPDGVLLRLQAPGATSDRLSWLIGFFIGSAWCVARRTSSGPVNLTLSAAGGRAGPGIGMPVPDGRGWW